MTTLDQPDTSHEGATALIAAVHRAVNDLALELARLVHRHGGSDDELGERATVLAEEALAQVRDLAAAAAARGLPLDPDPASPVLHARLGGAAPSALPGSALLVDLGRVYRSASGVELDHQVLAHTAATLEDADLRLLAARGREHAGAVRALAEETVGRRSTAIVLGGE